MSTPVRSQYIHTAKYNAVKVENQDSKVLALNVLRRFLDMVKSKENGYDHVCHIFNRIKQAKEFGSQLFPDKDALDNAHESLEKIITTAYGTLNDTDKIALNTQLEECGYKHLFLIILSQRNVTHYLQKIHIVYQLFFYEHVI